MDVGAAPAPLIANTKTLSLGRPASVTANRPASARARATASDVRTGTITNGMPQETSAGAIAPPARSPGASDSIAASSAVRRRRRFLG